MRAANRRERDAQRDRRGPAEDPELSHDQRGAAPIVIGMVLSPVTPPLAALSGRSRTKTARPAGVREPYADSSSRGTKPTLPRTPTPSVTARERPISRI